MLRLDVLFLIRSMGRGGAERQLSLLARALQARGLKVAVAVFYVGGELEQELHDAGVEVFDLKKGGRWSNVGVVRRLIKIVRERRPCVLHGYMQIQNIMILLLKPWLKRWDCAVVCGIRTAIRNNWHYSKLGGVLDVIHMLLLPLADRVISNSALALTGLDGHVAPGCGFVVPNGVECERFVFSTGKRAGQRDAWNVTESGVLLGLVARLDPKKNHRLLLDALSLAGDGMPNVRLVFVGDGPADYRKVVQKYAEALGVASKVLWADASDDLSAVYSALDIVCLSSVTEGFPNVIAEAMCAGLPCVATDVGDVADLMGDCGWVVPSGNAPALADALLQAYRAMPGWDRERPRARMVRDFSVDALADRTLAALAPFLRKTA